MKRFFTIIIVSIVVAILWWGAAYLLSFRTVSFSIQGKGYTITIQDKSGRPVDSLETSRDIRIRTGDYFYSVQGENQSTNITPFTVKDNMAVTVVPEYSDAYISRFSSEQKVTIEKLLSSNYPDVPAIKIQSITIDKTATWAYGKLTINNDNLSVYRFILKRQGDTWNVTIPPTIVISKDNQAGVPDDILYSLYKV